MEKDGASNSPTSEAQRLRAEIARFLREERLQPKLDKLNEDDPEARRTLIAAHQPGNWIADAARRVSQIQQVTHAIKFTHPSAGGSSLSSTGNPSADVCELGSHSLDTASEQDVVGNAAALDVYKFLRLSVDGRSLLDRAIAGDPALAEAFSDDPTEAADWMAAFAALPEPKGSLSSDTLAKQLYWPLGDGGYHLLAPLYASTLAHAAYRRINDDRFSDEARAAREARRTERPHERGYGDYPQLAIVKFGGSKPQNISQLNSERRGESYLLASLPPLWRSAAVRAPLHTETVFAPRRHFSARPEVRRRSQELRAFLHQVATLDSNREIRRTRDQLLSDLCDQVLQFAAELRELPPGWSALADCRLHLSEQCWLDPERCHGDEDFATHRAQRDWQNEVCLRFANWLNARLRTDISVFGAAEASVWRAALDHELSLLREEMEHA